MTRKNLISLDAIFLTVMSIFGLSADLLSYTSGTGPFRDLFLANPLAIGVVEAHGLALIAAGGALISRASGRTAHANFAAIHLLLGTANIAFFYVFINVEAGTMGVVITTIHLAFAIVQATVSMRPDGELARI